jgi:hypothetical protein
MATAPIDETDDATGASVATKIPPAVEGGNDYYESLGSFIDNLMGDSRDRAAAARKVAKLDMSEDESPSDPAPSEPPPAVPGGTESVKKSEDPPGETR